MPIPYDDILQNRLPSWSIKLQKIRASCKQVIQEAQNLHDANQRDLTKRDEMRVLSEVIAEHLGKGLYELMLDVWDFEDSLHSPAESPGRKDFFFWPGYIRHASSQPGRLDVAPKTSDIGLDDVDLLKDFRKDG